MTEEDEISNELQRRIMINSRQTGKTYLQFIHDMYEFNNAPIKIPTKEVFSWIPRRCSETRQMFWLTRCFKVSNIHAYTGKLTHRWHTPQGHTLWLLKGNT